MSMLSVDQFILSQPSQPASQAVASKPRFTPILPKSLEDTGLNAVIVEEIILKLLLAKGVLTGREIAGELGLHFSFISPMLADMKKRLQLGHRDSLAMGDFSYQLTELGRDKAMMARESSAYIGAAPVPFDDYVKAVDMQSIRNEQPTREDLRQAFGDLIMSDDRMDTLGPAINSGRGLFLYGEPGNGKTSIAERVCRCFKENIFIPRALWVEGQIIQLFDPQNHEEVKPDELTAAQMDQRWVLIKRPVVVVGGELTMDSLEITYNELMKISEAPLQLKANGGVFLIDDFGRQRLNPTELLNRWIVPLEKRIDYLVLSNGKKIQAPFDELIIFSTNLKPGNLVDEAFLRRIPYKVYVDSPSESEFRNIFRFMCDRKGIAYDDAMVTYLIRTHYEGRRAFRGCHPRDILDQILNASAYQGVRPVLNESLLDIACKNYFSAIEIQ